MKKLLAGLIAAIVSVSVATAASVRTTFEVIYSTGFFSSSPNEETRRSVLPTARSEIWKAYLSRLDTSTVRLIEQRRDEIQRRLDEIVTNIEFIDERIDKNARKMSFTVRAVVNDNMVSTLLSAGGARSGQGSPFGFLILPRIQAQARSFDATVTRQASATSGRVNEQVDSDEVKEAAGGTSERSIQGSQVILSAQTKTSGSVTRRAQKSIWSLGDAKDVDAGIVKYLSEAGYEPSTFADLNNECGTVKTAEVRADMIAAESGELSDDVRREVIAAMRKCEQKFFAIGTLDIDSIEQDRNSGGVRVRASVNIKVHDMSRRGAPAVASVGPVAYYGVGPQEDGARSDALKRAATEASQQIVNQLRAKNLN
jgi:hypothetical protein